MTFEIKEQALFDKIKKEISEYSENPDKREKERENWVERMFNRLDKLYIREHLFNNEQYEELSSLLSKIR